MRRGRCFRPPRAALLLVAGLLALAPTAGVTGQRPGPDREAADSARVDIDTVYRLPGLEASVTRGLAPEDRVPLATSTVRMAGLGPAGRLLDLHEPLRRVPGVAVDARHNLALGTRISIRGFGARSAFGVRGVRLILDGIPLTLPDGQATLTSVDLTSIDRIEVLRGPSAALYGNAAGGVVALHSADVPADGRVAARVASGSYGTGDLARLLRFSAEAGDRGRRGSWYLAGSHLESAGYREHSAARRTGLTGRVRYDLGGTGTLSAVVHLAAVPRAENPGSLPADSFAADPRMAWPTNVRTRSGEDVRHAQGGLSYRRPMPFGSLDATVHGQRRALENPLPFGRYIRLRRNAGGARLVARSGAGARISWTAGIEGQLQRDDRLERDNVEGAMAGPVHQDRVDRVASVGPFALTTLPLAQRLWLHAAGRYDAVRFRSTDRRDTVEDRSGERGMDAWSGSVGIAWAVADRLRAWSSASTWFQTPTTTELINAPPAPGDACCAPGFNPDLDPQEGWGWEVGLRSDGAARWEVVVYRVAVRNQILPFQVEGADGRDFFRNAGESVHRGLEASVSWDAGPGIEVGMAYALTDLRFVDAADPELDGNRIPGVAPHRLNLHGTWALGCATVGAETAWVGRYPVDDAGTAHNDGYVRVDVEAGWELRLGDVVTTPFLGVDNVFDARYASSVVINAFGGRYYEPAPGRSILLGARARFR